MKTGIFRFISALHARNQQLGVDWVDQQRVWLLGDGVEHFGDLQVGIALAVDDMQHDASVGRALLHSVDQRDLIFEL